VIFVSHNMAAVQNLCSRVLWLAAGRVVKDGDPTRIIGDYLKTTLTTMSQQTWPDPAAAPGNDRVRLRRAAVVPAVAAFEDHFTVRTPLRVEFEYWNLVAGTALDLAVVIRTEEGYPIFSTVSGSGQSFPAGLYRSSFEIPGHLLNDGMHRVELYIHRNERDLLYHFDDVLVFDVLDVAEDRTGFFGKRVGAVRPPLTWQTTLVEEQLKADTPPQVVESAS